MSELLKLYKHCSEYGKDFKDALCKEAERSRGCGCDLEEKYVEADVEYYLSEERDAERLYELLWDIKSTELLDFFKKEKIDISNYDMDLDRHKLDKLIKKNKRNKRIHDLLLKLKEKFEKDLEGERRENAYNMAWDNLSSEINQLDTDEEIADFFGIDLEIEGYKYDGEEYFASDVIGFCNACERPVTEQDLFCYNEKLKQKVMDICDYSEEDWQNEYEDRKMVGYCDSCGEWLNISEIDDKKIKMVLSL